MAPTPRATACLVLGSALLVAAAGTVHAQAPASGAAPRTVQRPDGWTDATHGVRTAPDYARLFSMDRVHELRITIPADQFKAMQDDLATLTPAGMPFGPGRGGRGARPGGPGGFGPEQFQAMLAAAADACNGKAADASCSASGQDGVCAPTPGGGPLACLPPAMANFGRGGAINLTTRHPIYVPVTVTYDGKRWTNVAMRYKGNSSLVTGGNKVPFRLDFDRNRKTDPRIDGQRFYGFRELTFSSNFADDSQIREVLASEVFRDRGVAAPRAAFYRIYVDAGQGSSYWGLYTMVEDPSDGAMLDAQLGGRRGNLYKPDGPGADWTTFDKRGFVKKNNEKAADYADVEAAVNALHAPRTDPARWRATLEARLNVDLFLRWLAVNTVVENWDTYGAMAHNYYLYADPRQGGRLRWIPWDNNMAFGVTPGGPGGPGRFGPPAAPGGAGPRGFGPPPGAGRGGFGPPGGRGVPSASTADVLHKDAGAQWPLIQVLLADDTYAAAYRRHLQDAITGLYAPDAFARRARELHALIAPAVVGPQGETEERTTISSREAFEQSIDGPNGLVALAQARRALVRDALAAPR